MSFFRSVKSTDVSVRHSAIQIHPPLYRSNKYPIDGSRRSGLSIRNYRIAPRLVLLLLSARYLSVEYSKYTDRLYCYLLQRRAHTRRTALARVNTCAGVIGGINRYWDISDWVFFRNCHFHRRKHRESSNFR